MEILQLLKSAKIFKGNGTSSIGVKSIKKNLTLSFCKVFSQLNKE